MDLELQHTRLGGYRPVWQALLRQEETLESIVPDALPDVSRIVQAKGSALLRQKETVDGSVRIMGNVRAAVIYLPENGGAPCCLSLNIPFLCSGDHPALQSGCQTHVDVRVLTADAQLLNPRKILARVELAVEVTVWTGEDAEVCTHLECGEEQVQTLMETHRVFTAVDVSEKSFSFSDVLRLPSSRPAMEQLLSSCVSLYCSETRVIGSKLIVKGCAALAVVYRSQEEVCSARFEMPFSQIVEISEGDEECSAAADAALMGMDCTMRDGGELEVSMEVLLQTVVRQEREVTLLADLYSVSRPLEAERKTAAVRALTEMGSRRVLARQFCETAVPARQVIDCQLSVGELERNCAGEGGGMTARVCAGILYLSEDNSLCAISCVVPVSCELPVQEGCRCDCRCIPVGEVTATPVTGGLEVRFEAEFSYTVTQEQQVYSVSSVTSGTADCSTAERPSVIIRMVSEGERLWDIAKYCGSTVADIQAANAMECAEAPAGALLLIPRSR